MRVVYTDEALRDLDSILTFLAPNYPGVLPAFRNRLRYVERRIGRWPLSAQEVSQRTSVRAASLVRYPYKIFYRVSEGRVEILHIHHAARLHPGLE